jgi:DNA-binding NarL/FixJ family response regulator
METGLAGNEPEHAVVREVERAAEDTVRDARASRTHGFTVGIADNDPYAARMLGALIRRIRHESRIAWTVTLGVAAVRRCLDARTRPDVLVTDMSMEDISGVEVTRQIRSRSARPGIVCATSYSLLEYAVPAAEAGAQACVAKTDLKGLQYALEYAADGRPCPPPVPEGESTLARTDGVPSLPCFLTADEAYARLRLREGGAPANLSGKERETLRLYAQGADTSQVATALKVHRSTVATYERRACAKLNAKSRAQAVWVATRRGLL